MIKIWLYSDYFKNFNMDKVWFSLDPDYDMIQSLAKVGI